MSKKRATRRPEARQGIKELLERMSRDLEELRGERPKAPKTQRVPRFREWALDWYSEYSRRPRKPGTLALRKYYLNAYLMPVLKRRRLNEIGQDEIQAVRDHLQALHPRTVNQALGVLGMILREALHADLIKSMPHIRLSTVIQPRKQIHEVDEYGRIVAAAERLSWRHHLAVLLAGDAGLRASEAAGLQREFVDLNGRLIDVSWQAWKRLLIKPKGNRSRMVAMTDQLHAALKAAPISDQTNRVIWGVWGRAIGRGMIRRWVREAVIAAGLDPKGGAHLLRHDWVSHLVESGAPINAVMEMAGHQDHKVLSNYVHASRKSVRDAMDLLAAKRSKDPK